MNFHGGIDYRKLERAYKANRDGFERLAAFVSAPKPYMIRGVLVAIEKHRAAQNLRRPVIRDRRAR